MKKTAASMLVLVALSVAAQQAAQPKKDVPVAADFQISGTLVDANTGQPVRRARVAIASVNQRDAFTTMITREDGRFLFGNLAPGKYTLTAQARGYLLQSFNQHDQFSSSIVVGPDLDSNNLLFRLPPEGAISGVVVDEAGEPVREAQVMLFQTGISAGEQATRQRGRTTTNDQGAYHFGHLRPGRYLVAVTARPWYAQNQPRGENTTPGTGVGSPEADPALDVAYPVTFFPGANEAALAAPIVLGQGEKFAADINLQPVPALHIRLNKDNDNPERTGGVRVEKRVLDGPSIPVMSQYRGYQEGQEEILGIAPGHYILTTMARVGASEAPASREIDVGVNGYIDQAQAIANIPVSAKLQLDPGTAPGQVSLQLINKRSKQVTTERAGSDSEIVFKQGVTPGRYEVSLFTSSGIYVKSISASGASVTGRTLEIRSGNAVKLTISAGTGEGQVKGTAMRDGKPFAGAMIVLVPADPAHNQVLFRRDQSDSDGSFTIAAVVPGAYTLLAMENGWDLEWTKPEVLRNYLGAGAALEVKASGKYDIKVPVQ